MTGTVEVRYGRRRAGRLKAPHRWPRGGSIRVASALLLLVVGAVLVGSASAGGAAEGAGASISGSVRAAPSGGPLEGVCVRVYESFSLAGEAVTGADGSYRIDGLAADRYVVGFNTCNEPLPGHAAIWWKQGVGRIDQHVVKLEPGDGLTGIDAHLAESGTVEGVVTDRLTGQPLEGICVIAVGLDRYPYGTATTSTEGTYSLDALEPDDYVIDFSDCSEPHTYVPEIYDDARPPYRDRTTPVDNVTVERGETTSGIDAQLDEGGAIRGTLTAAHTGQPVALVCSTAVETVSPDGFAFPAASGRGVWSPLWDFPMLALQDPGGEYIHGGLAPGSYHVGFSRGEGGRCSSSGYRVEWYDDADEKMTARPIAVVKGRTVEGVDATLHPVPSTALVCSTASRQEQFPDVDEGNVHASEIRCVARYGIATGGADGRYQPAKALRRDQMASFVARMLEILQVDLPERPRDRFRDDDGNTHEHAINQLAALGVVSGRNRGSYDPAGTVSRAAMTTFLVNGYELATQLSLRATGNRFGDDDDSTHEGSIDKAATAGFVAGISDDRYQPAAPVPRDQMASFLMRTADRAVRDDFRLRVLLTTGH